MGHDAKEKAQNGKRHRCRKLYAAAPATSPGTKKKGFAASCCGQGIHYQDMSPMWFNGDSSSGKNMSPMRYKSIVYDAIRHSSS